MCGDVEVSLQEPPHTVSHVYVFSAYYAANARQRFKPGKICYSASVHLLGKRGGRRTMGKLPPSMSITTATAATATAHAAAFLPGERR